MLARLIKGVRLLLKPLGKHRGLWIEIGLAALICGTVGWLISKLLQMVVSYGFLIGAILGVVLYLRGKKRAAKVSSTG